MAEYTIFDVTLSLLTPLHIGNGRELLNEYDYAIHAGKTWRINEAALLDAQNVDDPELAERLASIKPAQLLRPGDFRPESGYFRYVLSGAPRSKEEGAQLREQLKDPFDRPYLPGSSLKGALRTALAWHGWQERKLQPEAARLGRSPKWAAQDVERQIFGRDPNRDLLRALHVSDSAALAAERLMIINARVLNRGGSLGSPIELEALRPDTICTLTIKLDRSLFSEWARQAGLTLSGGAWLERLAQVVQSHSADRIQREIAWFKQISNGTHVLQFYQRLDAAKLSSRRCLVQLGWGTGWDDKTLGSRLSAHREFMERILQDYRLARGRRQPGDPFPKSRRVVMSFVRDGQGRTQENIHSPLGWCLLEMKGR
jgi:CRISPR-associated protein Csm5